MCYIVEDTFEFSPLILYSSQRRWWNMAQMSLFRTSKVRGHLSVLNDKVIPPVHATWWLWRPACLWLHRWSSLPSNSTSKQAAFLKKIFLQTFPISKINRRSSTNICFTTYGPPPRQTTARIALQSQMQLLLQSQDPNRRPQSPRFAFFLLTV